MESIEIKLENFEGPIALLYKLIEKNEIDIYDIPIAKLTEQYIEYISNFPKNMESISDFLVMAVKLIEIKSKMLLPKNNPIEEDYGEDPREELVKKLVEYKIFKGISNIFKEKAEFSEKIVYKNPEKEVLSMLESISKNNIEEALENITLDKLYNIFKDVISRKDIKKTQVEVSTIDKDIYTIQDKILYIKELLNLKASINFRDTFESDASKLEIIVTFMAILELIKTKVIRIVQKSLFDDIIITNFKKVEFENGNAKI